MADQGFGIWSVSIIALVAWTIGGVVYRLFLSPLAAIPGPKLAALTSWFELYYDVVLPGQYVFKIKEMHKQYGTRRLLECHRPD